MQEKHKTKEQLIDDLAEMRRRVAELEASEAKHEQAEEALRESEERYRSVVESIDLGMNLMDCDHNIVMVNAAQGRHFNRPPREMVGKKCFWEFEKRDTVCPHCPGVEAIATGQPAEVVVYRVRDDVGRFMRLRAFPTFGQDGTVRGFVEIAQEITERKRSEEKIEHLNLVLSAIRNVNQLITRERDRNRLLQGACETLIETRGYHSAWIALLDESEGPVATAEAGLGKDFLPLGERLKRGELPDCGRRALRQSGGVVTEDPSTTCAACPLSSMYDGRGAVTIRLEHGGKVYGLLSVSIPRDLAADKEEQGLFEEVAGDIAFALHNIELEKEAERRAAQAALIYEVGQRVSRKLELDELLSEIVTAVRDAFNYYGVMILLVDEEANCLTKKAIAGGYADIFPRNLSHAIGEGMTGYAAASGETQVSGDVSKDPHYVREADEETRSELVVPIKSGQKVIGVLDIQSDEFDAFDETDVMLMEILADQIAGAIENARLFEETRIRAEELAILNEMGRVLTTMLDVDAVIESLYHHASRLIDTSHFYVALYDPEQDMVSFPLYIEEGQAIQEEPFRAGKGLSGYVIRTREPLLIEDNVAARVEELGIEAVRLESVSWLGVPMTIGGEVIGMISAHSHTTPRLYNERHRDLLSAIANQAAIAIQNARLFEETRGRAERLAVVNHIAKAASSTLDLDDLMETVCEEITPIFRPDAFFIALYDKETNELDFRIVMDEGVRGDPGRVPLSGLSSLVVTEKKPLIVRDLEQEQDRLPAPVLIGGDKLPASWLGAPLMIGERVIGVINLQSYRPHAWGEEEELLLLTIADQVAVALENARLFEDTKSRLAQLTALQETSKAVASTLELDKLLDLITQQATTLLQGDGGLINLVDWEKKEDEVVVASGSQAHTLGFRSPLEGSLSGWVTLHNQPVISNQLQNDSRVDSRWRSGIVPGQNAAIAPLTIKDRGMGTLVVMDKQGGFAQADLDLLMAFANQAAIGIENAQLFEETQTRAKELTVLNEMGRVLTTMLDVDAVIESLYHHASRLIDATNFYVALYDPEQDEVHFPLYVDGEQVRVAGRRRAGQGLTEYVIRTREPLLIEENIAAQLEELGIEAIGQDAQSWLGVPMMIGDQVLGVITVQSYTTPRLYNERHRDLLTAIASQSAIAIQNARLFEQTKAALEALRASEERFALAVQGSNDGIWDWDILNDSLYWSPRFKELLGYADDELDVDFDTFDSLLHPDDREHTGAAIEAYLKNRGMYDVEQRQRTKSGEYRWFRSRGQALWDEDGNPIRMVGSSTDITERKRAEKALKEYSERLEEMVEERTKELRDAQETLVRQEKLAVLGQLAGGVGHELRNPLGAISSAIYFLNMVLEEPDPEVKETLEILQKEVKTSEKIISSLLDFARAKAPTRRKVNVNDVVQKALSHIAVPENVEVVSQLDEMLPIVLADPDQLVQVFGNIALNAVQAMPEGGRLVVKTEVPGPEWVAVSFADTGVGIPEENLDKLFEPLFTTKAKGIGLGMAVTKTLVEGHEGTIKVESEVGVGTTFTVRLPVLEF
jgi:PAS domain S-box-containing protein